MDQPFWYFVIWIITLIITLEFSLFLIINYVRNRFQWLITSKDETPTLSSIGLKKFFEHGYDSELGWVRKPLTSHDEMGKFGPTKWSINEKGSRSNPEFEKSKSKISCYGDSFTFSRQVNDDETCEHYLSELQNTNVLNFGVGNYGIDQTLLRLKREFPKNKTEIVILAVVPETIARILSNWKHYYEYGNTFAFKPRFILHDGKLEFVKNIIDNKEKFFKYVEYLDKIKQYDYFYKNKFRKEKLYFPYLITIFKNTKRNFSIIFWVIINLLKKTKSKTNWYPMRIIMRKNLEWRKNLYKNNDAICLFRKIIEEYVQYSKEQKFIPVFIFIPQKDDLLYIKSKENFYKNFENNMKNIQDLFIFDITSEFLKIQNLDELFSDDNEYGGHLSKLGNKKLAEIIDKNLKRIHKVDI